MKLNRPTRTLVLSSLGLLAVGAMVAPAKAHIGFSRDNAYTLGEEARQYKEGSTVFLDLTLPHACKDESGRYHATRGVRVLLPNAQAVPDTFTKSRSGEEYGANALMSVRARASAIWRHNPVTKEAVSPFYSHGTKTEDVRAIQWSHGLVDNDHYDRLEFRAKLPNIDPESCVSSIKVIVPAVQWCEDDLVIAWIGTGDSVWQDGKARPRNRVETDYAPAFEIVRTSELPARCEGGETIEVRPSTADINKHLGPRSLRRGMLGRRRFPIWFW